MARIGGLETRHGEDRKLRDATTVADIRKIADLRTRHGEDRRLRDATWPG